MHPVLDVDVARQRADRTSVKWRVYPPDVLPLWVAEMDAAPCEPVVEAVGAALTRGDTGYGLGLPYAESLARFAADRWGWSLDVGASTAVADVMIGVAELLRLLTDEGGTVIVSTPCYDSFHGFVDMIGRRRVEVPLDADGRLEEASLDEAFAAAARRGRAAYLLCNPQNPTGTLHTREELTMLAALADRHGVAVVSDEIHAPLVLEGTFTPYLSVPGGENGYAVLSASKAWNLAGLKAALVVAGRGVPRERATLHEVHTHGASHLGMIAHIAALDHGRDWLDQLLVELDANRRLLADLLAAHLPGVGYRPPAATYLAWLDCTALGLGQDPAAAFLERGRVALSSGPRYGTVGAGHARLNLATSPAIITEAVQRMARAVVGPVQTPDDERTTPSQ